MIKPKQKYKEQKQLPLNLPHKTKLRKITSFINSPAMFMAVRHIYISVIRPTTLK